MRRYTTIALLALAASSQLFSQSRVKYELPKTALEISGGWAMNSITVNEGDWSKSEGSPFGKIGLSIAASKSVRYSLSLSANKMAIGDISSTYLHPEVLFSLHNKTPVSAQLGGFLATQVNGNDYTKGFNCGGIAGLSLRFGRVAIYGNYLLGLYNILKLDDKTKKELKKIGIKDFDVKTRTVMIGLKCYI